jgi:uncharacterized Tic20 family protein
MTETNQPITTQATSEDEKTWGMLVHLSSLAGFFIGFGWIIAPLIIWLVKREEMPFVNQEGKNAMNFQITMAIAGIICGVLTIIFIGLIGLLAIAVLELVFPILAGLKAREGESYKYPLSYPFIK